MAKQPESGLLSTAQLAAPVSIAQPMESVRRSSRIQRSENRKRGFEDLSPQEPPAKRTKRVYRKKVNLTRGKISDDVKKATHNWNEKKRRNNIKDLLNLLRKEIPNTENNPRVSKFEVLKRALDLFYELKKRMRCLLDIKRNEFSKHYELVQERDRLLEKAFLLGIDHYNS